MPNILVTKSMLAAVTHVLGYDGNAEHYFALTDLAPLSTDAVEHLQHLPDLADTVELMRAGSNEVCVTEVGSEAYYGYVVVRYNQDGEIVHFIGVRD
jgi:hypothetical protein